MGHCDACGIHAPLANVTFRQNTGMIVMRQSRTYAGDMCKDCARSYFWKATLHTVTLGWWGTISFILTPIFIIANIASYAKTMGLAAAQPKSLAPSPVFSPVDNGADDPPVKTDL